MENYKGLFASKTIWGALIAILGALAPLTGLSFSAEDGAQILTIIDELMVMVGSLIAIYGRVTATKKIG